MAHDFVPDPWRVRGKYVDRTYPSGVANVRPKLTTRIHCDPGPEATTSEVVETGSLDDSMADRLNRQLRGEEEW